MAEKMSWTIKVSVPGGPSVAVTRPVEIDAYDKLAFKIEGKPLNAPQTLDVHVQPSPTEDVEFLYITSDLYGEALKYSVIDGAAGAADVVLDGPHVFAGAGMVGLLGSSPKKLEFSNGMGNGKDANITILVGRKVIA